MTINDILSETYSAVAANKMRSGLTILGIVIGIASVIAMVSIGQGAQGQIQSSIQGLGSNLLTVTPGSQQGGRGTVSTGRGSSQSLKMEDVESLKAINGVKYVSAELSKRLQVVAQNGNNTNTNIIGSTPDYPAVRNISISEGVFLSSSQLSAVGRVAVLGPTTAQDLFGDTTSAIGKNIRINKINFRVIGVVQSKGGSGFFSLDDTIYVPVTTMQKILTGSDFLSTIAMSVENEELMSQVQQEATAVLLEKHRVTEADFSIISQADILGALTSITTTFTIFLAAVAGISLLVGGIGIMNMMLTTITERTREIGLRKAIGAKKRDISLQFLAESVMLTMLGGLIGIGLGWLAAYGVSKFAGLATSVSLTSVLLAFGVSGGIGIIFGYYPARRAATLNPIDALKYE
ncbi:ABC transporter permease [Candidatus Gracilibacteria bacterium]|nr:ABC transporter permease [Candidatus Gracilibacteria bacterium]